jgi:hypothetical protein
MPPQRSANDFEKPVFGSIGRSLPSACQFWDLGLLVRSSRAGRDRMRDGTADVVRRGRGGLRFNGTRQFSSSVVPGHRPSL